MSLWIKHKCIGVDGDAIQFDDEEEKDQEMPVIEKDGKKYKKEELEGKDGKKYKKEELEGKDGKKYKKEELADQEVRPTIEESGTKQRKTNKKLKDYEQGGDKGGKKDA